MHTRLAMKRDFARPTMMEVRLCRSGRGIALALIVIVVSACFDLDLDLTGLGGTGVGGGGGPYGGCFLSCASYRIEPGSVRMLKGDTVRLIACGSDPFCGYSSEERGLVFSKWSVSDSSVLLHGPRDSAATSILVRAAAPGQVLVTAQAFATETSAVSAVTVADSSAIAKIELVRTSRGEVVYSTVPAKFDVHLTDSTGLRYRARPTGYSVSDTSILQVQVLDSAYQADISQRTPRPVRVVVAGLSPGTADFRVHFLGITAVVPLTVVH